jgi:hypothetical protein
VSAPIPETSPHPADAADPRPAIDLSRTAWAAILDALRVAADWTENDTDELDPSDRVDYLTQIADWRHLSTVITAALATDPDAATHRTPPLPNHSQGLDTLESVVADVDLLERLLICDVPSDTSPDSLDEFQGTVELIDGRSREFGTDVAAFLDHCLRLRLLHLPDSVHGIRAEPTVLDEARDGGYLLLISLRNGVTLASHRQRPALAPATPPARQILTAIADTANHVLSAYQTSR